MIHAAVAASLAAAFDLCRGSPLDVDLAVAEGLLGIDVVLVGDGAAVLDLPVLSILEGRHVLAVEEHDGIRRRAAAGAGLDDRRLRPDDRSDVLSRAGNSCSTPAWLEMASTAANRRRTWRNASDDGNGDAA